MLIPGTPGVALSRSPWCVLTLPRRGLQGVGRVLPGVWCSRLFPVVVMRGAVFVSRCGAYSCAGACDNCFPWLPGVPRGVVLMSPGVLPVSLMRGRVLLPACCMAWITPGACSGHSRLPARVLFRLPAPGVAHVCNGSPARVVGSPGSLPARVWCGVLSPVWLTLSRVFVLQGSRRSRLIPRCVHSPGCNGSRRV